MKALACSAAHRFDTLPLRYIFSIEEIPDGTLLEEWSFSQYQYVFCKIENGRVVRTYFSFDILRNMESVINPIFRKDLEEWSALHPLPLEAYTTLLHL